MPQTLWLDEYHIGLSALCTVAMQLVCFCVAYLCRFDLITDISGSMNFVLIAVGTLLLGGVLEGRGLLVTLMVVLSRCELGAFLLYRVCKRSKDARFDEMRDSCVLFLVFWMFQMMWVFVVSVPVILVNSSGATEEPLGPWDAFGLLLSVSGWVIQVCADLQKYRFRSNPLNAGRFCNTGIWRYSRHPNFFGEIVLWWGVFAMAVPVLRELGGWAWLAICSPLFTMTILLYLSGLPFAEGEALAKIYRAGGGNEWEDYARMTPPMWLLPPGFYPLIPPLAKWMFCCEFRFLRYQPASSTAPAASSDNEEADTGIGSATPSGST